MICRTYRQGTPSLTTRSPMCLQPHPPQVKMTPPHGWLIPLLHPARITLPMPPSAGQHCPTGSQSNSFNKQGSRCQLVPKPPTARSPMCLQPHPPQVKMTPPPRVADSTPPSSEDHTANASIGRTTLPHGVVNPTHSTSKDQDANLSPSHRQHGRRCAFNHIHHR